MKNSHSTFFVRVFLFMFVILPGSGFASTMKFTFVLYQEGSVVTYDQFGHSTLSQPCFSHASNLNSGRFQDEWGDGTKIGFRCIGRNSDLVAVDIEVPASFQGQRVLELSRFGSNCNRMFPNLHLGRIETVMPNGVLGNLKIGCMATSRSDSSSANSSENREVIQFQLDVNCGAGGCLDKIPLTFPRRLINSIVPRVVTDDGKAHFEIYGNFLNWTQDRVVVICAAAVPQEIDNVVEFRSPTQINIAVPVRSDEFSECVARVVSQSNGNFVSNAVSFFLPGQNVCKKAEDQ